MKKTLKLIVSQTDETDKDLVDRGYYRYNDALLSAQDAITYITHICDVNKAIKEVALIREGSAGYALYLKVGGNKR